jgi:hypothetical protein
MNYLIPEQLNNLELAAQQQGLLSKNTNNINKFSKKSKRRQRDCISKNSIKS